MTIDSASEPSSAQFSTLIQESQMSWFTFEIFRKGEAPVGRIVDQTLGPLLGPTGSMS